MKAVAPIKKSEEDSFFHSAVKGFSSRKPTISCLIWPVREWFLIISIRVITPDSGKWGFISEFPTEEGGGKG